MKKLIKKIRNFLLLRRAPDLKLHPQGEFISDTIRLNQEYYEKEVLSYCAKNYDISHYVDVGANIGNHIHFMAAHGAKHCVGFEPNPRNFELLKLNAPQAKLFNFALSDHEGEAIFAFFDDSSGNGHLLENFQDKSARKWGEKPQETRVPVSRLDKVGLENVTLLKIDVEGAELAVLRGAQETLKKFKPTIWIEMHEDKNLEASLFTYRRADIIQFLTNTGYQLLGSPDSTNFFFSAKN